MDLLYETGRSGTEAESLENSIKSLIETSGPLDYRDEQGNAALHYAAEFGILPAVEFLCNGDEGVNILNNCGNTPLQLVRHALQRSDRRNDIKTEGRYLQCAVILLKSKAIDRCSVAEKRSIKIVRYGGPFDGSEIALESLVQAGIAQYCNGLHLLLAADSSCGTSITKQVGGRSP
jgi:hypothetical protein